MNQQDSYHLICSISIHSIIIAYYSIKISSKLDHYQTKINAN